MEKKVIYVDNMVCQSCEKAVIKALKSIDDVTSIEADSSTGQVEIMSSSKISNRLLDQQLKDMGYPIREKASKGKNSYYLLLVVLYSYFYLTIKPSLKS